MANTKTANIDDLSPMASCLLAILALIIAVPIYLYQAWAVTVLWGWFIVPTWGGPTPAIITVMGVIYIVNLLWPRYGYKADAVADETKSSGLKMVESVLIPFLLTSYCLGAGWVLHAIQGSPLQ